MKIRLTKIMIRTRASVIRPFVPGHNAKGYLRWVTTETSDLVSIEIDDVSCHETASRIDDESYGEFDQVHDDEYVWLEWGR
jgi:hypothetical protein